ncbi:hypothetical protein NEHOM01_1713 [Nematocida homosporus]|uniref:uncharacterized protein n=1 Tax=Nematocida homosporus TaxID=1912981 RepID=UPI0022208545|nr:uncharacterized protein NEHOM01_1713 [Nematocida homosporus]KAI5186793.1 hypothetical protein NEHOM01_1713 [Nematocida homosporus]
MLGVNLAWLLGWSSDMTSDQMTGADNKAGGQMKMVGTDIMTDASNKTEINWKDHCIKTEDYQWIGVRAIEYDSNPKCSKMKFKEGYVLDSYEAPDYYVWKWRQLLKFGLLGDSDTNRIITMINNCHLIHNLDANICPNDLEKDSLLYAIDKVISDFERGYALSQGYIVEFEKLTRIAPGEISLSIIDSLTWAGDWTKQAAINNLMMNYNPFHIFRIFVPFDRLTTDHIKQAIETWKVLIENPTQTNPNTCAQKQLRHFLYDILRVQLALSIFSNLSNPSLSVYPNITISNDDQKYIDDMLKLNIADMIKNMPADEAAQEAREKLSYGYKLQWRYESAFVQPDYIDRLNDAFIIIHIAPEKNIVLENGKQLIDDMKKAAKWFESVKDKTKKLKTVLSPYLSNTRTASSIHECVEYLTTKPPSTAIPKSNHASNSPTTPKHIANLFWTHLPHLFGLSPR